MGYMVTGRVTTTFEDAPDHFYGVNADFVMLAE